MHNNNLELNETTQENLMLNWAQALNAGSEEVGGKAWNLGRLHRYDFNIPNGGVLPVGVYRNFIEYNQLQHDLDDITDSISLKNISSQSVKDKLKHLRNKFIQAQFPETFADALQQELSHLNLSDSALAVRSSASCEDSATASFAGIHDSYLNISAGEELLKAVKACYASLWSQRAIAYRRKMGIADSDMNCAVIIMQLINADAAGVAFSCDPASGREDVCLISANFGLGESVVQGRVEPDTYTINRVNFRSMQVYVGAKQSRTLVLNDGGTVEQPVSDSRQTVLSEDQQYRLCLLIGRVYSTLGNWEQHVDIEWALKDNRFYLLQSRPVTAMPRYTEAGIKDQADIWSNANFRDAVPMVISYLQRDSMMSDLNRIILAAFKSIGYRFKPGLAVANYIGGRAYFNIALYQWLIYDSIGLRPRDINLFMGGHHPDIQLPDRSPYFCKQGVRRVLTILKNMRLVSRYQKQQHEFYRRVDDLLKLFNQTDLTAFSDVEFLDFAEHIHDRYYEFSDKYMTLCGAIGSYGIAINLLRPHFGDEAIGLVNALVAGRCRLPSADQGYDLLALANVARNDVEAAEFLRKLACLYDKNKTEAKNFANQWQSLADHSLFKNKFQDYLDKYGFRANYELDCSQPRWVEDPSFLLVNVANLIDGVDLAAHRQRQQQSYEKALMRLNTNLAYFKRRWVLNFIDQASKGAETRETAKTYIVKLVSLTRRIYLEMGRRLVAKGVLAGPDEVFYCALAEVYAILKSHWDGRALPLVITERQQQMRKASLEQAPDVVVEGNHVFVPASPSIDGKHYQGIGVSSGVAEGIAEIICSPEQGVRLQSGQIMVAPSTDPSWTPLFLQVAGIVLETGGYTSHGSIVAREYGIPAVVNLPGILKVIKNGQMLVVNADQGHIAVK